MTVYVAIVGVGGSVFFLPVTVPYVPGTNTLPLPMPGANARS
jgi:hypothetical protein